MPGLAAKPIIDIQVSVASLVPHGRYVDTMATLGYRHLALHHDENDMEFDVALSGPIIGVSYKF